MRRALILVTIIGNLFMAGLVWADDVAAPRSQLYNLYDEKVREAIQREWRLINDESLTGLTAVIEVQIRKNGELMNVQIVKPSGNERFDVAAMTSVRKAFPMPPVPEAIVKHSGKLILTFLPGRVE